MWPFPRVRSWSSARAGPLLSRLRSPFSAFIHTWAGVGRQTIRRGFITGIGCNLLLLAPATRGGWGISLSELPGNVGVGASHTRSGRRKVSGLRSGQSDAESKPSGSDPPSPQPRPCASPQRSRCSGRVPNYNSQKASRPWANDRGWASIRAAFQPGRDVAFRAAGSSGKWAPSLARASVLVARLAAAKMAAEHPEPPKGELQLPPPPPPGHYGAWAAQELQAKLAEIGAPIQGKENWRSRASRVGLRGSGARLPRRSGGGGGLLGPDLGGRA